VVQCPYKIDLVARIADEEQGDDPDIIGESWSFLTSTSSKLPNQQVPSSSPVATSTMFWVAIAVSTEYYLEDAFSSPYARTKVGTSYRNLA